MSICHLTNSIGQQCTPTPPAQAAAIFPDPQRDSATRWALMQLRKLRLQHLPYLSHTRAELVKQVAIP